MAKVKMYTLSTCPWCLKTKKFFSDRKIPFTFIDYDLADDTTQIKIMQDVDAAGAAGFPFVYIGGEIIMGYQPQRYLAALGMRG